MPRSRAAEPSCTLSRPTQRARSIADPVASHAANASGSLAVLEAARRKQPAHRRGVLLECPRRQLDATEVRESADRADVALRSHQARDRAYAYQPSYGLPTLALRFFNVFGPLQGAGHNFAAVIPAFVDAALAGQPPPLGEGLQSRDFTYVGSVCAVIASALERTVTDSDPVNLAFGSRCTLLDVAVRDLEVTHGDERAGGRAPLASRAIAPARAVPRHRRGAFETSLKATINCFRGEAE